MYPVACDACDRTLRGNFSCQVHNWHRRPACARLDGQLRNETRGSHGEQLIGGLHVHATNGLPTANASAAGNPEANAATPTTAPTSTFQGAQPSATSSGIVPAVIAVAIFVVCVFVALRILRIIRLNRLVAAYVAEPETPRMWEVRLDNSPSPSFEGRWNEIMPLAVQRSTECDTVFSVDEVRGLPGHVAVLVAMPAPNWHASAQGRHVKPVGPICIGVVNM